jgi:hypothetical protein
MYDMDDGLIPYQEFRYEFITRNVLEFIKLLRSILASVSYCITKTREGCFHSNVHLILVSMLTPKNRPISGGSGINPGNELSRKVPGGTQRNHRHGYQF